MSLQINPCLYDEKLQYSDQYMPIAMMPAIVEAIGSGGGGGGGGTAPLIVTINSDTGYTDKTFGECWDAFLAGRSVLYRSFYEYEGEIQEDTYFALQSVDVQAGGVTAIFGGSYTLMAESKDDYMFIPD